jgi:hypothetical protein
MVTTPFDPKGLDSDIASAAGVTCQMVTFTGSGTVVIKAAFVSDPSVYSEWTFNVSPNLSTLATSIIAAQGYTKSYYTAASWKTMQAALASSIKMYNAGAAATTQEAVVASKAALDNAVANLVAINTPATGSSSESNPGTGASSDVFPALMVAIVALGGIIVTVKKTILNK